MGFFERLARARTLLQEQGRVSLRALARELELEAEALDELVEELVDVQQVAAREGKVLSWMGAAGPAGEAAPATVGTEAERRQLTLMFCDLVGSTDLSQRLDAEDWREVVRAYQEAASRAIAHFEGHVAQYLGDGLLVYFGWPQAHEDDAERAVRAGREIPTLLRELNDRLEPEHGVRLAVRVGIHTGPVVVGAMGAAARSETLALGDTPNVAARLQGLAEADSVVISDTTLRLVAGMFATRDLGAPALKGLAEPIHAYAVLQSTGVRSRLDASRGRLTHFVGRQTELGVLADAWERVIEGQGQTVLVSGEAGLGKSRLCFEFRRQLAGEPHTWLECQCSPFTTATAFHPVIELVGQALGFQPDDAPAEKLRKLGAGLALSGLRADETLPLLAEWLGLPESAGYTPLAASAEAKRQRTLETLTAWNLRLSELQPLVVLVQDLHWCDPSSLELLGRLVAQGATARVLLVGTARPEFESPWPARESLKPLTLGRLTRRQARELIGAVSTVRGLPEAVVAQLVARADGVPLYAEELTRAVVEPGGETSTAAIPVTLQDSLLARLDRLSSAKEVAQRAAALGREFSYPLLAAVAELDEGALREGLARLAEAELLFARGEPPAATYRFKHALVQEAAYESLLKRTRQQLHGRVVDVLREEFPERAAAEPELLARHAEAAGRIDDAIDSYQRAGEQAQAGSAYEEAIQHLRRAIALLATLPEGGERDARELALQLALAGSLAAVRGFSHLEVEPVYARACVLSDAVSDARQRGLAQVGLAIFYTTRGEVERGRGLAAQLLATAEQSGDRELAVHGHIQVAIPEFYQGKSASSLVHLEAARNLYEVEKHGSSVSALAVPPGITLENYSAWNLLQLGWPDRALAHAREAVAPAREFGHPFSLAFALFCEVGVYWYRRDVTAQRERAAEVVALSEAQGFPLWLGIGRAFHAAARVAEGEADALPEVLAGLALAAETGNQSGAPFLFALVAEAYLAAGQLAQARGAIDGALAIAAQTGQHFFDAELQRLRGEIQLAGGGDPAEAEARFQRALDIARAQEARSVELRAATSLARLWRDQGKRSEVRALLAPVYAWFTEGFGTQDLVDAKALLDELG